MKKVDVICVSISTILLLCAVIVHCLALLLWKDLFPNKEISTTNLVLLGMAIGLSFLISLFAIGKITRITRMWYMRNYRIEW